MRKAQSGKWCAIFLQKTLKPIYCQGFAKQRIVAEFYGCFFQFLAEMTSFDAFVKTYRLKLVIDKSVQQSTFSRSTITHHHYSTLCFTGNFPSVCHFLAVSGLKVKHVYKTFSAARLGHSRLVQRLNPSGNSRAELRRRSAREDVVSSRRLCSAVWNGSVCKQSLWILGKKIP